MGESGQSASVEYLLEDDAAPRWRGRVLLLVLLVLGTLGALQWKSAYLSWPGHESSTRAATPAASAQPQNPPAEIPASQNSSVAAPVAKSASESGTTDSTTAQPPDANKATAQPGNAAHSADSGDGSNPQADSASDAGDSQTAGDTSNAEDKANAAPAAKQDGKATRESRAQGASPASDQLVDKGMRYIEGRGVQQNCEQGLIYLHAAASHDDPGAAVELGSLYNSGTCVAQDRVQAYRWFSSALERDPQNTELKSTRREVWSSMTRAERLRAGAEY